VIDLYESASDPGLSDFQLFGDATNDKPPSAKDFDHVAKRRRRSGESSQCAAPPAIHVHLPGYDTGPKPATPLTDYGGQRHANASATAAHVAAAASVIDLSNLASSEDEDAPLVTFPSISTVLRELHTVMPLLDYPQYESSLLTKGIFYVNNAALISRDFFVDIVGMPEGAVGDFLSHCKTLMRRAMKGKGKANHLSDIVIKKEEN
jgi:hypothetical protein